MIDTKYTTFNPSTGALLNTYDYADNKEVQDSLSRLNQGYLVWQKKSFTERQQILFPLIAKLENVKVHFAKKITEEMGKTYSQSLAELDKTMTALRFLFTDPSVGAKSYSIENSFEVSHKPKGVILGIMPWNYPLWQAARMIFPALLMGNTVLLKSSEISPTAGLLIKDLFKGLDIQNIFDHLIYNHQQTESLIADHRVQGLSITGSVKAGYTLSQLTGKYLKKGVFELGGSDAYLVLDDADFDHSSQVIAESRLQNNGQTCISAKRAFISETQIDDFLLKLKKNFSEYHFGDLYDAKTKMGPLASHRFKKDDLEHYELVKKYCEVICEIEAPVDFVKKNAVDSSKQAFAPIRLLKVKNAVDKNFLEIIKKLEFFSPTLLVFSFSDVDQAISAVNQTDFGLGGAVFSKNIAQAKKIAQQFQAGTVAINQAVKSDIQVPFGGVKSSGLGREMGWQGLLEFTDTQVINLESGF